MRTRSFTDPLAPSSPAPRRHGRVVANVLAGLIGVAMLVLFEAALVHLLETGTCASGGPYLTRRPCPSDTGLWILLLTAAIFIGLIAAMVFAGTARGAAGWGSIAFGTFFTVTAVVAAYAALFDDRAASAPGAQLGGLIVAAVFLPMGLVPLILGIKALEVSRREGGLLPAASRAVGRRVAGLGGGYGRPPGAVPDLGGPPPAPRHTGPAPRPTPPPATWRPSARSTGAARIDPLDELAKLAELRKSGVLTEAEFQAQKAKLLGEV
jgi:hypothetical protein